MLGYFSALEEVCSCLLGWMKTQPMKIREAIMSFSSKYPDDKVLLPSKEAKTESKPPQQASAEGIKPSQAMLVRKDSVSVTIKQQAVA